MEDQAPINGPSTETPDNTVGAAVEAITNAANYSLPETPPDSGQDDQQNDQQVDQATPPPGTNSQPPSRNYEGLNDSERRMFQRMSNEAYNTLYPIYLERRKWTDEKTTLQKQLEELRNASFYEEENAYRVTPEYQTLEQTVSSLNGEAQFWNEQLVNIENGQPYSELVLDRQGNVAVSNPITEYNQGAARARVQGALTKAHTMIQHYGTQLQTFGESYKTKYTSAKKSLEDMENRIFAGADLKKLDQAAAEKLKLFPSGTRNVPAKTLARALVVIDGLIAMAKRNNGNTNSQRLKQNISQAAGPSNGQINSGVAKGQTVGSFMDELKKARALNIA